MVGSSQVLKPQLSIAPVSEGLAALLEAFGPGVAPLAEAWGWRCSMNRLPSGQLIVKIMR